MLSRPATAGDLPALVSLQRRWDTHWFGAPEHDEAEVRESFDRVEPLADRSRLLLSDDHVVAAAWWWSATDEATLLVDPPAAIPALYDDLVRWLATSGARRLDALDRDALLLAALERAGWRYVLSSYELVGPTVGWQLDAPAWPAGVTVSGAEGADPGELHRLVYEQARWADVPGHGSRPLEQWESLFLPADVDPSQQVLARRDGRLVGAALGRTFSDGTGWVAQLAVAEDERGRGLGRALLLEAFGRRVAAGATQLGLAVSAANPGALRLYLGVGLVVDREWRQHAPVA